MTTLVLNSKPVGSKMIQTSLNWNEGTLEIYDTIVPWKFNPDDTEVTSEDVMNFLKNVEGDFDLRISSRGGEVGASLTIFNRLREYDGNIRVIVDGYAFSSAGWIALVSDNRWIATGGIWMCHNPIMYPEVNSMERLEQIQNQWKAHQKSIIDIFLSTTNLSEEEITDMMNKETFLSAEEAVEKGLFKGIHNSKADLSALNYATPKNLPESFNIKESIVEDTSSLLLQRQRILQDRS